MKDLGSYFENCFLLPTISQSRFRKFAADHLRRIKGAPVNPLWEAMIAQTQGKYDLYDAAFTVKDEDFNLQQGHTLNVDTIIASFKKKASQYEGAVISRYGKDSPVYQEFYPQGKTEYSTCNKTTVEGLIRRLAKAFGKYSANLGADYATKFNEMLTSYLEARGTQVSVKGSVSTGSAVLDKARQALAMQLYINLLDIAKMFIGDAPAGLAFFDQAILRLPKHPAPTPGDTTGMINGSLTDSVSGQPIANAVGTINGLDITFVTDEDGEFYVDELTPGTYTLMFACDGYIDASFPGNVVTAGQETELTSTMIKKAV